MTTSAIQALATGLPVITTNHSGFSEQVTDGKNGFMVPEGDYEALAAKIIYLMDHSELWAPFGKWGREHMRENYDANKLINKQVSLYESLLATK